MTCPRGDQPALVRHYGYDTETGMLDTIQAGWDATPTNLAGNTWFQYDRYTRTGWSRSSC